MTGFRILLGFLSVINIATVFPFAATHPAMHSAWLLVMMTIPTLVLISIDMSEAMMKLREKVDKHAKK